MSSTLALASSAFARLALGLVAPLRCAACDARLHSNALFCSLCVVSVTTLDGRRGEHRAVFSYGGAVAEAIARYKYGRRSDLAPRLGNVMAQSAESFARTVDVVVSVPLHPRRLATRGFDQAALLARPIAQRLLVPWAPRALERVRETSQQASLDRARRETNVDAAFRCRRVDAVAERRILLVDDVRTTGATLSACVRALRTSGARSVFTMVLARRDRDDEEEQPLEMDTALTTSNLM